MPKFTYAEIFGGILGFGTAFDQLGGECVFVSEIDKFAQQAIIALGKGDVLHGDITKVKADDIPQHDVLSAGFPCPAFSVAGSRGGMEYVCSDCSHEHLITFDEYVNGAKCPECGGNTEPKDIRGLLFFEVARVAQAKKPRVVLLENVKGLLSSSDGDVMRTIMETLNEIGYAVDFELLNTKYFDLAQSRDRVFIAAVRDDVVDKVDWTNVKGTTAIPKAKRKLGESAGVKSFNFDFPEQTEVRTRLRDFLEDTVDERYYLSDDKTAALVAQLEAANGAEDIKLTGMGRLAGLRNRDDRVFAYQGDAKRSTAQEQIYLKDGAIADSVTVAHAPKYIEGLPIREETKRGYAVNIAFTLTSIDRHGVAIGEYPRYRIRKLTPLECWRLQGFSDEAHEIVKQAGLSDSQRYKQAGNAVSVPVIRAIGERLVRYL